MIASSWSDMPSSSGVVCVDGRGFALDGDVRDVGGIVAPGDPLRCGRALDHGGVVAAPRGGTLEDRRAAIVNESNAIGTAYLRAQTLPEPSRTRSLDLLRQFTDASIRIAQTVPASAEQDAAIAGSERAQRALWSEAGGALAAQPTATAPRLYVESLNETFDAQSTRIYGLDNRVGALPALVAGEGFEPSKLSRRIYSPLPLAARATCRGADGRIATEPPRESNRGRGRRARTPHTPAPTQGETWPTHRSTW